MAKKTNGNFPSIVGLTLVTDIDLARNLPIIMPNLMANADVWSTSLSGASIIGDDDLIVGEVMDDFLSDSPDNERQVASWLAATFSGVTVDWRLYDILTDAENIFALPSKAWTKKLNASFKKVILPVMKEWATTEKVKSFEAEKARAAAEQTELIAKVRALGYEVTPIAKKK